MAKALILTDTDDPWGMTELVDPDVVVALILGSPETLASLGDNYGAPVVSADDLFTDVPELKKEAFALAHTICESLPRYRNVDTLLGFETRIGGMLLPYVATPHLMTSLKGRLGAGSTVIFPRGGPWAQSMAGRGFGVEIAGP